METRLSMWAKLQIVLEAAFLSLIVFRLLTLVFVGIFPSPNVIFYSAVLFTHYLTVLICGFWTGFKIRIDGWLYSIAAYAVFYVFRKVFAVYYPLPLDLTYKLLMLIPLLALLMIGAIYGEIAGERWADKQTRREEVAEA